MKRIDALDRKMILNFLLVVTTALTGLGLLASTDQAQTRNSSSNQKEMTMTQATKTGMTTAAGDTSIRPFPKIHMPQEAIDSLRKRIADTQWPEKETVPDSSQGVPLAMMRELAQYWATDYDWRRRKRSSTDTRSSSPTSMASISISYM